MEAEVKIIDKADTDDLVALYRGAGWWDEKTDDASFLDELIKNSFCFVGVFLDGKLIGMGRSISDGVSDAYIQDVTVLPQHRNKGLGGKIIIKLVEYLKEQGLSWIGLVGEPGTASFYKRLGFKELENYIPMLLKD